MAEQGILMRTTLGTGLLLLALLSSALPARVSAAEDSAKEEAKRPSPIGRKIANFTLRDFRGKSHQFDDHKNAKAVVVAFLGTECPLAKLYASRVQELADRYRDKGVAVIAVNSNVQDSVTEIGHYARVHKLNVPMLKDVGNVVADRFGAERTPEVFVLDSKRVIRYWGAIDDQYDIGIAKEKVKTSYVADALDAVLAGKKVARPVVEAPGCHIGRVREPDANSDVTYSNQIARILQRRCVECHRKGEIAPFALTEYKEVYGWSEMIEEVIQEQRMPPWHANPKHGKFINDARMTDEEKKLVSRWVDAGAPEGDRSKLPPPRKFTVGWRIGKPDQIVHMRDKPFEVRATGELEYKYFEVDPGFTEDKWIRSAECKPGVRSVVHHIIVFVKPPGGDRRTRVGSIQSDWLAATAPGAAPMILPEGLAKFVPAGSKFVFQMHYTPNGSVQHDLSSIGLVFADPKKVRKEVGTWRAVNARFKIPPGAHNHKVTARHTFRENTLMLAMFPHMHLRGKSFRYEALYPDGKKEILLDIPKYDFNWQNSYVLAQPKRLPAGTELVCTAHFDNSEDNLANPDSTKTVRWGDQTWDEMMIGYFAMMRTDQDLTKKAVRRTDRFLEQIKKVGNPQVDEKLKKAAAAALDSKQSFNQLGLSLKPLVPQLDRMDLVTIDDNTLRIKLVSQAQRFRRRLGPPGISLPATGMALAKYAGGEKTVVHQKLDGASQTDLKYMARSVAASMHVPVKVGGKSAVISFWSTEADVFPGEAVKLLEQIAGMMSEGR